MVPRLEALALLPPLWLFASGCGSDCAPIECSPAVIVRAELSSPVSATLEGSVRLCHRTSCLEAELALDPADSAGWEIRFDESLSAARFVAEGERWTLEAEIHPASPNGFVAGDPYTVVVRDADDEPLLAHEGFVADKLQNDACGLPCAIQRVDL